MEGYSGPDEAGVCIVDRGSVPVLVPCCMNRVGGSLPFLGNSHCDSCRFVVLDNKFMHWAHLARKRSRETAYEARGSNRLIVANFRGALSQIEGRGRDGSVRWDDCADDEAPTVDNATMRWDGMSSSMDVMEMGRSPRY
jgi:hypothetical protein